jgi:uncharacterized protein (TIGR02118 family)
VTPFTVNFTLQGKYLPQLGCAGRRVRLRELSLGGHLNADYNESELAAMLKFMVVLYRRKDLTPSQFAKHLHEIHGPLARKLPGLRRYVQNYPASDPKRKAPAWDAIVELYWDDRAAMEAAWKSPEGAASDADLPLFVDMERTSWSVVKEVEG